jgi:DNA repair protein RAD5
LDDVFSLLHFLKAEPYSEYPWWSRVILKPIKNKDEKGLQRLQMILEAIMLRRTKDQKIDDGKPIVALPPRTITLTAVEFNQEESELYQQLWNSSKNQVAHFIEAGTLMENYAHILELLLRLRQVHFIVSYKLRKILLEITLL